MKTYAQETGVGHRRDSFNTLFFTKIIHNLSRTSFTHFCSCRWIINALKKQHAQAIKPIYKIGKRSGRNRPNLFMVIDQSLLLTTCLLFSSTIRIWYLKGFLLTPGILAVNHLLKCNPRNRITFGKKKKKKLSSQIVILPRQKREVLLKSCTWYVVELPVSWKFFTQRWQIGLVWLYFFSVA